MGKFKFVALSINPSKLENKLLKSLRKCYSDEDLARIEVQVVCQGFDSITLSELRSKYPFVELIDCERVPGTISYIRKYIMRTHVNDWDTYDYVILIDDDFVFGSMAINQYCDYINQMDNRPEIGLISCHRRMNTEKRLQLSEVECPYPQDLAVISMRTGLIVRTSAIAIEDMFDESILYHEEFYLALQIYLKGYEIGKGWIDVYHQSRNGGLGCSLQKNYQIFTSNEATSSKKVAHLNGLFDVEEGEIYYGGQNVGRVSQLAIDIHNKNKEGLMA